ncbi:MAG: nuclear transport factor 2 family protein [Rhodocyclaceae bacterium]|jgi:hypothetical protein|nr:nuclear transport factor 2 family protein [Rhodocyclaceae bacterium]
MELSEMMAHVAIQDTQAHYVKWADGGRPAEFASLFTEDCVYTVVDRVVHGRAGVEAFLAEMIVAFTAHPTSGRLRHHLSSVVIDLVSPAEARATAYFMAVGPHGPDHWGNYRDRLVKVGERWLFAERRVQIDGRLDNSVATTVD